jgi:phosphohistidine swiveling domain-containing protein
MKFQTKAKNLHTLRNRIKFKFIPKLFIFKVSNYLKDKNNILQIIQLNFLGKIVIRSSAFNEDSKISSNAGKYKSFVSINSRNIKEIEAAILDVIKPLESNKKNEFFVQEMVQNVKLSGVCTTYSTSNLTKSYNINYHFGKDTTNVTSGLGNNQNFYYIENSKYKVKNKNFLQIIKNTKKLEKIFKTDKLDVEFAITKKNKFFLLQVRPQVIVSSISNKKILNSLSKLERKIKKIKKNNYNLYGNTTYFGVMPDWNPAEMIGIKPRPLALSLYKKLITDSIWAKSRVLYGYNDVRPNQLMTTFFGTPYIDLRIDLNSWLPNNISNNLKKKLTNYYLNKFYRNNNFHDKIEFKVIYSNFEFNILNKIQKNLKKKEFKQWEINSIIMALKDITINAINSYENEITKIKKLKIKQKIVNKKNIYEIDKIFLLVKDCKNFGTLPFAGLARCAFIATSILNSLVEKKVINNEDREEFLSSIKTITTKIIENKKKLNKNKFIKIYGHLRPNMYEINNKNYKDGYADYFKKNNSKFLENKKFYFTNKQKKEITNLIKNNNININNETLIKFIKDSIRGREYAKFIFSKSLDLIFVNIKKLFKRVGIKQEDASFVTIETFLNLHNSLENKNLKKIFETEIKNNKEIYSINNFIKLPSIINSPKDLYINLEKSSINYVTNKLTKAKIIKLDDQKNININKKIVLIENADPGYDFIFNQNISGLITKYGGINSHMAIRCVELGIPAAIGVGCSTFEKILNLGYITLDCSLKKIY